MKAEPADDGVAHLAVPVRVRPGGAVPRGRTVTGLDLVAAEEPLELRLETRSVAVIMRTPGHDDELVAGFLLSEGILRERADLKAIRRHPRSRSGNVVEVFLDNTRRPDWSGLSRHVMTSASCGLCGVSSIRDMRRRFPRIRDRFRVSPTALVGMPSRLRGAQAGFAATGGLQAAGLFDGDGAPLRVREDIGRHNAVDKVIGRAFLDGALPLRGTVLLVSGRVSFEIVQKALAAGIAFVASVGAPSSLAVSFARANGQTLVGFLREDRYNIYAGPARIAGRRTG